ncbi:MAG: hypothetical protein HYS13_01915 [Planctomycetia bacterium]|nr:hypothetical protein [Planctomycetia bacterium]
MRGAFHFCAVWLAAVSVSTVVAADASSTSRPPVFSRQASFSLPFQIAKPEKKEQEPVAVQLLVSTDQGKSWQAGPAVRPEAQKIPFRAARDGEHWFCVKTRDASGQVRPASEPAAELKVVVDTTTPVIHLHAAPMPSGAIAVRWEAADTHLAADRLTIEYRPVSRETWTPVTLPAADAAKTREVYLDSAEFVPTGAAPFDVRAEIADLAGNTSSAVARIEGPAPGTNSTGERPEDAAPPPTRAGAPLASSSVPQTAPTDPLPRDWPPPVKRDWPGQGSASTPLAPGSKVAGNPQDASTDARPTVDRPPTRPVVIPFPRDDKDTRDRSADSFAVNSRKLEVHYQLAAAEPASQRTVELWGTSDGGQTWKSYGVDRSADSRIAVEVPQEGTYGFRFTVQSGRGQIEFPPMRGDKPEFRVDVDLTPPTCQLTDVRQPGGSTELVIFWETQDHRLAERPVTLKFRSQADGPWITLAANLENSGKHTWRMDDHFAHRPGPILLQLEVRDAAGNVTALTADSAATPDWPLTTGRVQGVRPLPEPTRP